MTIACGDSHTSTHGAFGAIAFGIGTSQVRDVLASQCLALDPLKVRRIDVDGTLAPGRLRQGRDPRRSSAGSACNGGVGYAYEYGGSTVDRDVDGRADDHLQHVDRRRRARRLRQPRRDDVRLPQGPAASRRRARRATRAVAWWRALASDPDATYDDRVATRRRGHRADVTWGINPGQSVPVGRVPRRGLPRRRARVGGRGARLHGLRRRRRDRRARGSTSPSSAPARTGASPTSGGGADRRRPAASRRT